MGGSAGDSTGESSSSTKVMLLLNSNGVSRHGRKALESCCFFNERSTIGASLDHELEYMT